MRKAFPGRPDDRTPENSRDWRQTGTVVGRTRTCYVLISCATPSQRNARYAAALAPAPAMSDILWYATGRMPYVRAFTRESWEPKLRTTGSRVEGSA